MSHDFMPVVGGLFDGWYRCACGVKKLVTVTVGWPPSRSYYDRDGNEIKAVIWEPELPPCKRLKKNILGYDDWDRFCLLFAVIGRRMQIGGCAVPALRDFMPAADGWYRCARTGK